VLKKALRTGVFDEKEYVGNVLEVDPGVFLGSIHQVPPDGNANVFNDHVSQVFSTQKEAEEFVISTWAKKFNLIK
jgi:hypothetical protein